MRVEEPAWWYRQPGSPIARLLAPLGHLYGMAASARMRRPASHVSALPVICIGNVTAGGTGKSPMSHWVCRHLIAAGRRPVVLSRGYGGRLSGPHLVDPRNDRALDVGDEPLLAAAVAPVVVARDRGAGAAMIARDRIGDVIVMDDGLQSPALAKSLTIAMVDARRAFGNGHVIPAGPLRAPLSHQVRRIDAVVINHGARASEGATERLSRILRDAGFSGSLMEATVAPSGDIGWLQGQRVLAFAGIAAPERFAATLTDLGADVADLISFPDHHAFSDADAVRLLDMAQRRSALLVTTEKDHVRLASSGPQAELARLARVLPIRLELTAPGSARLGELLDAVRPAGT
ncbi:MAG: tetraacyldisaccharide 4'-kinase [Hyphomicrobiales bacterium]|nr:tetraacyldisaccharide 4'-kinase [Hyphomicrobiales bacterium]